MRGVGGKTELDMVMSAENPYRIWFAFHWAIQRIEKEGDPGYLVKEVVR